MEYKYKFLSDEEKEDILVNHHAVKEQERFAYVMNLDRYDQILGQLPAAELQEQATLAFGIEARRKANPKDPTIPNYTPIQFMIINRRDTENQLWGVQAALDTGSKQLPVGERFELAKQRYLNAKAKKEGATG